MASTSAAPAPPALKPSRRGHPPLPRSSLKARRRLPSALTPSTFPARLWLGRRARFRHRTPPARTRLRPPSRRFHLTLLSGPVDRRRFPWRRIARGRNVPARAPLLGRLGTATPRPPDAPYSSSRRGARWARARSRPQAKGPRRQRGRRRIPSSRWRWGVERRVSSTLFVRYSLFFCCVKNPLSPRTPSSPLSPASRLVYLLSTNCSPHIRSSLFAFTDSDRLSSAFAVVRSVAPSGLASPIPTSCIYCIINVHVRCTYYPAVPSSTIRCGTCNDVSS